MNMNYLRLTRGFGTGILVKPEDLYNEITDHTKDWYVSTYYYNDFHLKEFKQKKSVAGIRDVVTDKIWFDFDSDNTEESKDDAITLVSRLMKHNIKKDDIEVYYSGGKGFHVLITVKKTLNPQTVQAVASKYAGDLKTFDKTLYDSNQILRVPGTKHQSSGLYKIPLTVDELLNLKMDDIKTKAKSLDDLKEMSWGVVNPSEEFFEVPPPTSKTTTVKAESAAYSLDLSKKPKNWKNCKWSLLQGNFKEGQRHEALMILAATARGMNFDKDTAYYLCKAALKKQSEKTGQDEFPKEELYNNIIESTYRDSWTGGQYTCQKPGWLQDYCQSLDHPCEKHSDSNIIKIDEAFNMFKNYATNIDNLTIKTGIPALDKKLRMTVGMSVGIVAPPGVGKCLGKDTPVLMYNGSIKMVQDVQVGDLLMGDDSTPRTVLSTTVGQDQLYKVKQNNGDDYIVNSSHILSLRGSSNNLSKYSYDNKYDIEIGEYLKKGIDFKKRVKGYKVSVEFSEKSQTIDPYFLGYWLGNGTATKTELTIHREHIPIVQYMEKIAYKEYTNFKIRDNSPNSIIISLNVDHGSGKNPLREKLKDLNIFDNKHIPSNYLTGSRKQRLQLLAGLIDSDGYSDPRGNFEIIQKNKQLADDIVYLSRSLGFKTTIKECVKGYKDFKGTYQRIHIMSNDFSDLPLLLDYKKIGKLERQRFYDLTEIKIEEAGFGDYYGFELDGNHRFLLGDFTVTHNTSLSLQILNNMSKNNEQALFLSYDMFHALVFQKLIQKHFQMQPDEIFKKFKSNDVAFQQKVIDLIKQEYNNVHFCFRAGQTYSDILDTIKEAEDSSGKKVKLLVCDYNELVITDMSDSTSSSNYVAQKMREIANVNEMCVLSLFQPNKISGSPADEVISYRAAKGGSGIEQSVSVMLGMSRPGYDPRKPENDKFMSINCLKNRMGSLFGVDLKWDGLTGSLSELTFEEEQELQQLRDEKNNKDKDDKKWD